MSVRKLGFALIDLFDIFFSILFPLSHPLKFIFLSLLLSKVASSDEIFQGQSHYVQSVLCSRKVSVKDAVHEKEILRNVQSKSENDFGKKIEPLGIQRIIGSMYFWYS